MKKAMDRLHSFIMKNLNKWFFSSFSLSSLLVAFFSRVQRESEFVFAALTDVNN